MNEIQLSNDLNQIELEINHHKNIAGQSIWEIGRRLNHVKENDLSHGEFISWVESIGFDRYEATRFMKVANELPNVGTLAHLGLTALNLIATLPEEERTKEHVTEKGETKTPDEMTTRELKKLKKQLKEKETDLEKQQDQIHKLQRQILSTPAQELKVIEKEVEVVPADYEHLKSDNQQLNQALKEERKKREEELAKKQMENEAVIESLKKENQNMKKIRQAQNADVDFQEMTLKRLKRESEISVYQIVVNIQSFLREQALTDYHLGALANTSDPTKEKMLEGVRALERYANELKLALQGKIIFEEE